MNFFETAVLATICFRLRSSGLIVVAAAGLAGAAGTAPVLALAPVEGAAVAGPEETSTEATCALIVLRDSLYCFRLSRYSSGVRIAQC